MNSANVNNVTPLGIAAEHSHSDIVTCLLDEGATVDDLTIKLASDEGNTHTVTVLRTAKEKQT